MQYYIPVKYRLNKKLTAEHVTIRFVLGAQSIPVINSPCWSKLSNNVQSLKFGSYLYIWTSLLFGISAISISFDK